MRAALEVAEVIEVVPHATLRLTHAYEDSGAVAGVLRQFGLTTQRSDYGAVVTAEVSAPQAQAAELAGALRDATAARARVEVTDSDRAR